ncbi:Nonaspanin (TM9SF) [Fragilaria crotonensis]|nr:Nonaspanin (TM9SF) [Fragilaria crotonensis]
MLKLLLSILVLLKRGAHGYYESELNQRTFAEGDPVELKVNKLTSMNSAFPFDYYQLPFCQPAGGPKMDDRNFGEFLARDRIESSPYVLAMKKDAYCEQLCVSHLGSPELKGVSSSHNKVVSAIRKNYHNNWIVDNLPAASRVKSDDEIPTRYGGGFPIGYVSEKDNMTYIYNHVNIEIMYHPVETDSDKYRIVRFTVEPLSIKHEFEVAGDDDNKNSDGSNVVKFVDPVQSCDPHRKSKFHTDYNTIHRISDLEQPKPQRSGYFSFLSYFGLFKPQLYTDDNNILSHNGYKPQLASGHVLFTYDVIWIKNTELEWTSRWDIYLTMDHLVPAAVHWYSIQNSLIILFGLSAILVVYLKRDISRYKKLATDEEEAADHGAFGWQAVHADVFRPPASSPLLLSVACGTGAQILCSSFLTITLCTLGFVGPARRGSISVAGLFVFVIMGVVAGYVTARMYKTCTGTSCHSATRCTSLGFPGIAFAVFYILDRIAPATGRADAIPFTTMVVLMVLWFGISVPLVFLGSHLGDKHKKVKISLSTSTNPRPIPGQPWFTSLPFGLALGGIIAFNVCYVELFFIVCFFWTQQFYCTFGVLLLVFILFVVTCAAIGVLFCYFQLRRENYRWWWSSFCVGGSPALYAFWHSFFYVKRLEYTRFEDYVYYFGYMGLGCCGLFLMTGVVGVFGTLWFNKILYSSIKIGDGK